MAKTSRQRAKKAARGHKAALKKLGVGARGQFLHVRLQDPAKFDKRSFRTQETGEHRIVFACPKGEWSPTARFRGRSGKCKTKVEAITMLHPWTTPEQRKVVRRELAKRSKRYKALVVKYRKEGLLDPGGKALRVLGLGRKSNAGKRHRPAPSFTRVSAREGTRWKKRIGRVEHKLLSLLKEHRQQMRHGEFDRDLIDEIEETEKELNRLEALTNQPTHLTPEQVKELHAIYGLRRKNQTLRLTPEQVEELGVLYGTRRNAVETFGSRREAAEHVKRLQKQGVSNIKVYESDEGFAVIYPGTGPRKNPHVSSALSGTERHFDKQLEEYDSELGRAEHGEGYWISYLGRRISPILRHIGEIKDWWAVYGLQAIDATNTGNERVLSELKSEGMGG